MSSVVLVRFPLWAMATVPTPSRPPTAPEAGRPSPGAGNRVGPSVGWAFSQADRPVVA